ncbi:oxidation resistance protein [Salix suchowensis]|nr:oxidation resistance protein [Salix suchowensis]
MKVPFVSDLTTVILNPISVKPSKHPTPRPHPLPEDASESKTSQLEPIAEEYAGHLAGEPDTSSFTAFLFSLLSSSESGNVAKESGTKKGSHSRAKQSLRAIYEENSDLKIAGADDSDEVEMKSMLKQNMKEPVALGDLPDISEPSLLLSEKTRGTLYDSLPALVQGRKWLLLYSTWRHGISLSTLYRRSMLWPGPCLLAVGDRKGAVFGGLVEAPLRPTTKKYQGSNSTFVFTNTPGYPVIFHPTGANRYFTLCSTAFLAIGGGGHFAIYLDSDLSRKRMGTLVLHTLKPLKSRKLSYGALFMVHGMKKYLI